MAFLLGFYIDDIHVQDIYSFLSADIDLLMRIKSHIFVGNEKKIFQSEPNNLNINTSSSISIQLVE